MVSYTGRTTDTHRIRRLKSPLGVEVEVDAEGFPFRLRIDSHWQAISLLRRPWRVDQHWWRSEDIRRVYYLVAVDGGAPLTIYSDLVSGRWFRQEYG